MNGLTASVVLSRIGSPMALEVINDTASEPHRNWISSKLIRVLGVRLDMGLWVLQLEGAESGGVSIALTGPSGALFRAQVPKPGRHPVPELDAALARAVARLS